MILLGVDVSRVARRAAYAAAAGVYIVTVDTRSTCSCTAGCYWCGRGVPETITLGNFISSRPEPPIDYVERDSRARESARIAAGLEPLMREPQVVGLVPRRRPIRGATPRRFAFYQGLA
jgi:hypothetical protein